MGAETGIEVTPAMIKAGALVLEQARGPFGDELFDDERVAEAVYRAMMSRRGTASAQAGG